MDFSQYYIDWPVVISFLNSALMTSLQVQCLALWPVQLRHIRSLTG